MIFDKYAKEFSSMKLDELSQVQSALDEAIAGQKNSEIQALRDEISRKASLLGISTSELLGKKQGKPRKPIEPKYRIVSNDGLVHEWSGRGLKPKVFQPYSKEELEERFRI